MRSYYDEKISQMEKPVIVTAPIYSFKETEEGSADVKPKKKLTFLEKLKFLFKKDAYEEAKPIQVSIPVPEDLTNSKEDKTSAFIQTFTSFCGADCVVVINDKIHGELSSIAWYKPTELEILHLADSDFYDKELATRKPIILKATWSMFSCTDIKDINDATIIINFSNEYGAQMHRVIKGASTLRELSGISVDSVILEGSAILVAESMTDYMPGIKYTDK